MTKFKKAAAIFIALLLTTSLVPQAAFAITEEPQAHKVISFKLINPKTSPKRYSSPQLPVTFVYGYSYSYSGDPTTLEFPQFKVQRKIGEEWVGVEGSFSEYSKGRGLVVTAPPIVLTQSKEYIYYRVVSVEPIQDNIVTSSTYKYSYENPLSYKGMQKTIYSYMKSYCPYVNVIWDTNKNRSGSYTSGNNFIAVNLSKMNKYTSSQRKTVALHECAHYIQYKVYGNDTAGQNKLAADAKKIFKHSKPTEHMADCMARAAYSKAYLGYGGSCSKKEISYAKKVWRGGKLL